MTVRPAAVAAALPALAPLAAAVLVVAAGGCGREEAPPPIDVESALDRAGAAMTSGRPAGRARADSLYRAVLAAEPDRAEARYGLAMVELDGGRPWSAQWNLQRLLHVRPDHAGALSRLGLVAYAQGRLDDAIPYLERLAEVRSLGFDESVALADACNRANRFEEAESVFVAVGERFPDVDPVNAAKILDGRAQARRQQGRLEEAAADLAAAVATGGASPGVRVRWAAVLADLGRAEEAREALPDLDFEEAKAAGVLADLFVLRSRLLPEDAPAERIEEAVRELERVEPEAPDDLRVPQLLARLLRRAGDLEGARAASERHAEAIRSHDRRAEARAESRLASGGAREAEGDLEGALALYREGLEEDPDSPNLHCAVAAALDGLGRRKEEEAELARLRGMAGGTSPATLFLTAGHELRRRGLPAAAARQFALAAERLPGDEEPVYLRALALVEAGDWDAAVRAAAPLERPVPAAGR